MKSFELFRIDNNFQVYYVTVCMFCFGVFERSVIVKQSKTGRVVISNMFLPVHCG